MNKARPVTAAVGGKKKKVNFSKIMMKNRAQRRQIEQIQKTSEIELEEQKQKQMENLHPEGVELGGLYHGIDDVASDVTYFKDD